MSDFGEGKMVNARKQHRCVWCGELILEGSKAYYYRGLFDNEWQNWHMHPECEVAMERERKQLGWGYDEGFDPYANKRGMTEGEQPAPPHILEELKCTKS